MGRSNDLYYLPKDLVKILKKYFNSKSVVNGVDNISLIFSKYIIFDEDHKPVKIENLMKEQREYKFGLPRSAIDKYREYLKLLKFDNGFEMKTASRTIVGLGQESVYETSIKLHRNYGVPVIPGSALKGVARSYAIIKVAEVIRRNNVNFESAIKRATKYFEEETEYTDTISVRIGAEKYTIKEFREIFGTIKKEGKIIFFDSLPNPEDLKDVFEIDIMNPHYQPYYSKNEAPGDWHDPQPILFLTVRSGVRFKFWMEARDKDNGELLRKAKALLVQALKEHGVGAKTSLGYGKFQEVK